LLSNDTDKHSFATIWEETVFYAVCTTPVTNITEAVLGRSQTRAVLGRSPTRAVLGKRVLRSEFAE
jgi:hypothetical protein